MRQRWRPESSIASRSRRPPPPGGRHRARGDHPRAHQRAVWHRSHRGCDPHHYPVQRPPLGGRSGCAGWGPCLVQPGDRRGARLPWLQGPVAGWGCRPCAWGCAPGHRGRPSRRGGGHLWWLVGRPGGPGHRGRRPAVPAGGRPCRGGGRRPRPARWRLQPPGWPRGRRDAHGCRPRPRLPHPIGGGGPRCGGAPGTLPKPSASR